MTMSTRPASRTPRVRVTLALGLLWVLSAACGDSEPKSAPPPPAETSAGKAPAPPAAQQPGPGSSQTEAGEGAVRTGEGAIPEGFPADLPLYPDATPTRWNVVAGSGSVAAFEVQSEPQAVYEFFTEKLPGAGWQIESKSGSASYWAVVANKSGRKARISIVPTDGGTEIGVAVVETN